MNNRKLGRMLERREKAAWDAAGWETDIAWPEYRMAPGGRPFVGYRDFFHRYDLMAARPDVGMLVLLQVSTESESSHQDPGPLGMNPEDIDVVMVPDKMLKVPEIYDPGVYEIYVFYRKLKARGWVADRRWWTRG